ncbi:MAG: SOS response-associated peptidase family protein [Balneolaceae bacterium]
MSNRIALFASGEEVEKFTGFQLDHASFFQPRYNIAPDQLVDVICESNNEIIMARARWGIPDESTDLVRPVVDIDEALTGLGKETFARCIVPVSGYYKWKRNGRRSEYPFFIRMLDEPVMALAAVITGSPGAGGNLERCAIIQSGSNALVQPLDPEMPLQLNKKLASLWLDPKNDPETVTEEARKLFLMTDMTVLRVSKRVNDLSENSPELIQPLPK